MYSKPESVAVALAVRGLVQRRTEDRAARETHDVLDLGAAVHGHPGAAGRARGPARVVRRLADAGRVRPGDVLVAPTTAPEWTPLFTRVAAVVTDTGGVLCHGATVAREYGIPAVVGAAGATALIRDDQPVEVDGAAGVVRLLQATSVSGASPDST